MFANSEAALTTNDSGSARSVRHIPVGAPSAQKPAFRTWTKTGFPFLEVTDLRLVGASIQRCFWARLLRVNTIVDKPSRQD